MANWRWTRSILVVATIVLIAILLVGCDKKVSPKSDGDSIKKENAKKTPDSSQGKPDGNSSVNGAVVGTDSIELVLYFSDDQAEKLIKEVKKIPNTDSVGRAAINGLIDGPAAGGVSTIPEGTRLLDVNIKDGQAIVDLSQEFIDNHPGGSAGERLTVYSIVNTMTELDTIKSVVLHVEGKSIDTISGHMDISQPLSRDESML